MVMQRSRGPLRSRGLSVGFRLTLEWRITPQIVSEQKPVLTSVLTCRRRLLATVIPHPSV